MNYQIVVFGMAYGVVLLPVILSIVGNINSGESSHPTPKSPIADEAKKEIEVVKPVPCELFYGSLPPQKFRSASPAYEFVLEHLPSSRFPQKLIRRPQIEGLFPENETTERHCGLESLRRTVRKIGRAHV